MNRWCQRWLKITGAQFGWGLNTSGSFVWAMMAAALGSRAKQCCRPIMSQALLKIAKENFGCRPQAVWLGWPTTVSDQLRQSAPTRRVTDYHSISWARFSKFAMATFG